MLCELIYYIQYWPTTVQTMLKEKHDDTTTLHNTRVFQGASTVPPEHARRRLQGLVHVNNHDKAEVEEKQVDKAGELQWKVDLFLANENGHEEEQEPEAG